MKKIFLSSVIFLVLTLIGCQENSGNNPISADINSKTQDGPHGILPGTVSGEIPLDRMLVLYGLGNTYFQIEGKIQYNEELISDQNSLSSVTGQYDRRVEINFDAVLSDPAQPGGGNTWNINSRSDDVISNIPPNGGAILTKYYTVPERNDGLTIVCEYSVKPEGVSLSSIRLENSFKD